MWFLYAVLSALCFGARGILYQWTSQRPINRSLLLFGVYLSGGLIAWASNFIAGQPWTSGAWTGVFMGIFSFVANAAMYRGFASGKASIVALLTSLPPVIVTAGAWLLWKETLNIWQALSFVIIMSGMLLIRYSSGVSFKELRGAGWGLVAMLFFGLTDLSAKQATLLDASTLPALTVMYATGALLFGSAWLKEKIQANRKDSALHGKPVTVSEAPAETANRPALWPAGRTLLWGMTVGISNIGGMMFIMPAFRGGLTGLVSAIIAMNAVIVLLYARVILKETFSRNETIGIICAVCGVIFLRLAA